MKVGKICCGLFLVGLPFWVQGSVWISEIHYNPDGSDSGYEWIEWWNPTDDVIDLSDYKFKEGGVNHGLKEYRGALEITSGERIVIADNPNKFLELFSTYSGTIIDSAFSLNNTGELLEIIAPLGNVVFEVTYTSETGGNGNGNSIGLVDEVWYETLASPGESNMQIEVSSNQSDSPTENTSSALASTGDSQTVPVDDSPATYIEIKNPEYQEKTIKVDAGGDRTVMAGVSYWFSGTVYGLQGGTIDNPEVRWNWGDGSLGHGPQDMHVYTYPGTYTLTMSANVQGYSARDRVEVQVIEPALSLGLVQDNSPQVMVIKNSSPYSLELSGYVLNSDTNQFIFPDDSYIAADAQLVLVDSVLGFEISHLQQIHLQDGRGQVIDTLNLNYERLHQQVQEQQIEEPRVETMIDVSNETAARTHSVAYVQTANQTPSREISLQHRAAEPASFETASPGQQALLLKAEEQGMPWQIVIFVLLGLGMGLMYLRELRRTPEWKESSQITIVD